MATKQINNEATEEQYNMQRALYRIRRDAIKKGIKAPVANLTDPGFRRVMFGPLSRSKKLWRTNADIRVAVDMWCTNRAAAEERYGHISKWDVSSVTDMSELFLGRIRDQPMQEKFRGKDLFNDDISRWDVSNVTNMKAMFCGARSFNQPIGGWDVSNVKNMSFIFYLAESFNQNLNRWKIWDTWEPSHRIAMFTGCGISEENKPLRFQTPQVATPQVTTPLVTTPQVATPLVTTPQVTIPQVACVGRGCAISGGAKKSKRASRKRSRKGRCTLKRGARRTRRRSKC